MKQNTNIVFSTTSFLSIFEKRLSVNTENKNYPTLVMNQLVKGPITLILNLPWPMNQFYHDSLYSFKVFFHINSSN